ncbi:MAG: putative rRNA-processing protein EBP2 [Paramarteilia canceri]
MMMSRESLICTFYFIFTCTRKNIAAKGLKMALSDLKNVGYQIHRPDDYFAEMYKSDEHIHRIRKQIKNKEIETERKEKMEHIKQLRAYGKKIKEAAKNVKEIQVKKSKKKAKNKRKNKR